MSDASAHPVGIVGLGALSALGDGPSALFHGLVEGRSGSNRSAPDDSPFGAVDDATPDGARALAFGCRVGEQAIRAAGWTADELAEPSTWLVLATTKAELHDLEAGLGGDRTALARSTYGALAAPLARELGIGGPSLTVSVACASGLSAVGVGMEALRAGEAHRVVVIGLDVRSAFIRTGFGALGALDRQRARPFDVSRSGLNLGEGAAACALELRAEASIQLFGYGASNDAHHLTAPARDGRGLVSALRGALDDGRTSSGQVGLAVLHGTGTRFNDAMENVAYEQVFGPGEVPSYGLKGAVGHTMGAAGLLNLVACSASLKERLLLPNIGLEQAEPEFTLDLVRSPRASDAEWAVTTASGFAGVNAAVLARRGPLAPSSLRREPAQCVLTAGLEVDPKRPLAPRPGLRSHGRGLDGLCRLGLAAAEQALEAAGWSAEAFGAAPHGILLGSALGSFDSDCAYLEDLLEGGEPSPRRFAFTLANVVLGEVARRFDLRGESLSVSAGGVSTLAALALAHTRIRNRSWQRALVLGLEHDGGRLGDTPAFLSAWVLEEGQDAELRGSPMQRGFTASLHPAPLKGPSLDGSAGASDLLAALGAGDGCHAQVRCASGHAVRWSLQRHRVAATSAPWRPLEPA